MTAFADLSRPLALLRLLAADHPDLPALDVHISKHSPDCLRLSIHHDLGAFEAWREALGIAPESVRHNLQSGDTTTVLTAHGSVADAAVELVSFSHNLAILKAVA